MIESQNDGKVAVILSGETDIATFGTIIDPVSAALDTTPADVLLRIAEVTFIDSTGSGALGRAWRASAAREISFAIDDFSPQMGHVRHLAELDGALTLQPAGEARA